MGAGSSGKERRKVREIILKGREQQGMEMEGLIKCLERSMDYRASTAKRMATILCLRYGGESRQTYKEVAAQLGVSGVSVERVRQLQAKALRILRHPSRQRMIWAEGLNPDSRLAAVIYGSEEEALSYYQEYKLPPETTGE